MRAPFKAVARQLGASGSDLGGWGYMVGVLPLQALGGGSGGRGAVRFVVGDACHGCAAAAVGSRRVTGFAGLVLFLLVFLHLIAVARVRLAHHHPQPAPLPSLGRLLWSVLQVTVATRGPPNLALLFPIVVG